MCFLIVLRGTDPEFPLIVASNRDEEIRRRAAPPGLFVGERGRMLSPRDRQAGGTWLALNARGHVAGLTNWAADPVREVSTSRGEIPHLALDQEGLEAGVAAVAERCADEPFNSFQLVLASPSQIVVLLQRNGALTRTDIAGPAAVLTNAHPVGRLQLPEDELRLAPAAAGKGFLDRCAPLRRWLLDEGEESGHPILKRGNPDYGTVSSSLIGVPEARPGLPGLEWFYAAGDPSAVSFKNYGNLGKRLVG